MSEYTLEADPMGLHYFRRPDKTTISSVGALDELNALLARAEKAEAERDELMRKLSEARLKEHWESSETERQLLRRAEAAEAKLARFWSSPSCSPEIVQCSQKSSSSQPTKVETISALQAATTSIPVTTARVVPDWQRVRIDAAIAAMQGIASNRANSATIAAEWAIDYANVLVAELKKGV